MILPRFGIEDRGWLVGVVLVVLAISALEPYQLPGAPPPAPENDVIRWIIQIPAFLAGIGLLMLQPRWASRMAAGPGKWIGAFALWQLLVAAFALKPTASTVLSVGFLSYVGVGAFLVARRGWAGARGYFLFTLAFIVTTSTLLYLLGRGGDLRLNGIMSHPNHLGGACGLAMIMFLHRFLRGANWALGFFFLSGALLYLTDSRTAMAGTVLGLIVLVSDLLPRWSVPTVFALLLTVGILLTQTSLLDGEAQSFSRSGSESELSTLTGRTDIWEISVGAIEAAPITGYGPGATTDLFKEIKPEGVLGSFEINHAHNLWLQLGLIGGLPSIAFVTFGLIGYAVSTRGNRVRDRDAIVLAIIVFGISEPVISAEPNLFLIILSAAIASAGASPAVGGRTNRQNSGSNKEMALT